MAQQHTPAHEAKTPAAEATAASVNVTQPQLARAFLAWDSALLADPASFATEEQCRQTPLDAQASARAAYFMTLLREVAA